MAVDAHPDFHSSRIGRFAAGERGITVVEVQHHHAHALSCMAEHGLDEAVALVFDGTGLGTDGTIWGAELLHVDGVGFERLGSFAPVRLPGADAAVRYPARQLAARFFDAGVYADDRLQCIGASVDQIHAWHGQCARGFNAPFTHAAGRLFDAVSVALGLAPIM
ncbi:MAG: hypothetical protein M5R36_00385 [Deltaproteobacteria bacterium]|nr:hypothetical protein [Deltaproteobacteria bacterium]